MSRPFDQSNGKTSATGAGRLAMVYMCECGAKWIVSTKPAWECKCGRQLVKRNGIIHAAIGQKSGQMASRSFSLGAAAD